MAAKTPTLSLKSGVVPPKKSGRKPKEVNSELFDLLASALAEAKIIDGRPEYFGPDTQFDTEGKATAEARRYVAALTGTVQGNSDENAPFHGVALSVRAIPVEDDKYEWAIYKKMTKNGDSPS